LHSSRVIFVSHVFVFWHLLKKQKEKNISQNCLIKLKTVNVKIIKNLDLLVSCRSGDRACDLLNRAHEQSGFAMKATQLAYFEEITSCKAKLYTTTNFQYNLKHKCMQIDQFMFYSFAFVE